jgi:hypothetical protein
MLLTYHRHEILECIYADINVMLQHVSRGTKSVC